MKKNVPSLHCGMISTGLLRISSQSCMAELGCICQPICVLTCNFSIACGTEHPRYNIFSFNFAPLVLFACKKRRVANAYDATFYHFPIYNWQQVREIPWYQHSTLDTWCFKILSRLKESLILYGASLTFLCDQWEIVSCFSEPNKNIAQFNCGFIQVHRRNIPNFVCDSQASYSQMSCMTHMSL